MRLKLDPEVAQQLTSLVRSGLPLSVAAEAKGISKRTLMRWLAMGREDDAPEPYATLATEIDTARAHYTAAMVGYVNTSAKKDWKAAAWILERRAPEDYSRQTPAEVTTGVNTTVALLVRETGLTAEAIRRAMDDGRIPAAAIGEHSSGRRYIADTEMAKRALLGDDAIDAAGEDVTHAAAPSPVASMERARLDRVQALAEKAQLDVAAQRRELLPRAMVQAELEQALGALTESLLQLGPRLASELAHMSDATMIQAVIEGEHRRALGAAFEAIQQFSEGAATAQPPAGDAAAT